MCRLKIAYIAVLLLGLVFIECRTGWTIFSSHCGSSFPTVMAVVHFLFWPEAMQYVATADLKKGHKLQEADLTKDPKLRDYLEPYLPMKSSRVGKYLQRDIAAGKPVRPQDIGASPPMMPEKWTYIVSVRLRQQPSSQRILESQAPVTLSFPSTTEKLEGTVVGETSIQGTSEPTAKLPKADR